MNLSFNTLLPFNNGVAWVVLQWILCFASFEMKKVFYARLVLLYFFSESIGQSIKDSLVSVATRQLDDAGRREQQVLKGLETSSGYTPPSSGLPVTSPVQDYTRTDLEEKHKGINTFF